MPDEAAASTAPGGGSEVGETLSASMLLTEQDGALGCLVELALDVEACAFAALERRLEAGFGVRSFVRSS